MKASSWQKYCVLFVENDTCDVDNEEGVISFSHTEIQSESYGQRLRASFSFVGKAKSSVSLT